MLGQAPSCAARRHTPASPSGFWEILAPTYGRRADKRTPAALPNMAASVPPMRSPPRTPAFAAAGIGSSRRLAPRSRRCQCCSHVACTQRGGTSMWRCAVSNPPRTARRPTVRACSGCMPEGHQRWAFGHFRCKRPGARIAHSVAIQAVAPSVERASPRAALAGVVRPADSTLRRRARTVWLPGRGSRETRRRGGRYRGHQWHCTRDYEAPRRWETPGAVSR